MLEVIAVSIICAFCTSWLTDTKPHSKTFKYVWVPVVLISMGILIYGYCFSDKNVRETYAMISTKEEIVYSENTITKIKTFNCKKTYLRT